MKLSKLRERLFEIQREYGDIDCTIMKECDPKEISGWKKSVDGGMVGVQIEDNLREIAVSRRQGKVIFIGRELDVEEVFND